MKIPRLVSRASIDALADSVEKALAAIATGWNRQHDADGRHTSIVLTGTATAPEQPRVSAYYSTTQSVNNATWTPLTFDSEDFDTTNLHDISVNTDRVSISHTGLYLVSARAAFAANTTGSRAVGIAKNGTTSAELQRVRFTTGVNAAAAGVHIEQILTLLELREGVDFVAALVYQDSGGALNVGSTSRFYANELIVAKLW
jgi:hypothetical protein